MSNVDGAERDAALVSCFSAEDFAKSLRSSALCSGRKLELARAAWGAPDFLFPGRRAFLLEWAFAAMLKSVHFKEQRFGDPPYLNANYWSFLRSLLEEATGCGAVDSPSLVEPFSVAAFTSLKTPVVPLFTGFASRLARELETSAPNDGAPTCLLDGGHVLATLLELSSDCLRMLANSDAGSAVLSSSLDYQAALIPPLVDVLFRLWDTKTGMDRAWRTRAQRAALCTLSLALMLFESQLAGQGNQKKVFTLVTGKLLAPLLRLRCSACGKQEECFECLCSVNAILRTSLFHISTIADYFSVLPICPAKRDGVKQPSAKGPKSLENDGGGNLIQSYQRALFHELAKLAQNRDEDNSFVLDALPFLLSEFVQAVRRRGRTGTTASVHNDGTTGDNNFAKLEHAFFMELYRIVVNDRGPSSTTTSKKRPCEEPTGDDPVMLMWRNKLLRAFQELNICKPEVGKAQGKDSATPYGFLKDLAEDLKRRLFEGTKVYTARRIERMSKLAAQRSSTALISFNSAADGPEVQSATLHACQIIIEIDHSIIAPYLNLLCEVLVKPACGAEYAAAATFKVLLRVYTLARELGALARCILDALRKRVCGSDDGLRLVSGPVWWAESLDCVYTSVSSLSPPQAAELLEAFSTELASFYTSPIAKSPASQIETPTKKKRRREIDDDEISAAVAATPDALCSIVLTAPVLRALAGRIGTSATLSSTSAIYKQNEAAMNDLWGFVEMVLGTGRQKVEAVAAVILACAVVDVMDVMGEGKVVEGLRKIFHRKYDGGEVDALIVAATNMLRMRVISSLRMKERADADDACRGLLRKVLRDVLGKQCMTVLGRTWDGRLESVTDDTLHVVLWRVCVERMDLVNAYATAEQLDGLLAVLVKSLVLDIASAGAIGSDCALSEAGDAPIGKQHVTIISCSRQLFLTPDFWEMRAVKDRLVSVCLSEIQSLLRVVRMPSAPGKDKMTKRKDIIEKSSKNEKGVAPITAAFELLRANARSSAFVEAAGPLFADMKALCRDCTKEPSKAVGELAAAMGLLASLPPRYLEKNESSAVLAAALLVDRAVHELPDLHGRLRCAVACRTVTVNLVKRRGDGGVTDRDPRLLLWMMGSCAVDSGLMVDVDRDANESATQKNLDRMVDLTCDLFRISMRKVVAEAPTCATSAQNLKVLVDGWDGLMAVELSDDNFDRWVCFMTEKSGSKQLERERSPAVSGVLWRIIGGALGGVLAAWEANKQDVRGSSEPPPSSIAVLADRVRMLYGLSRRQLSTLADVLSVVGGAKGADQLVEAARVRVPAFASLVRLKGFIGEKFAEAEVGEDLASLASLVELLLSRCSASKADESVDFDANSKRSSVVSACLSVLDVLCNIVRNAPSVGDARIHAGDGAEMSLVPGLFGLLTRVAAEDWDSDTYRPRNAGLDAVAFSLLQNCSRDAYDEIVAAVLEEVHSESATSSPGTGSGDCFTISLNACHLLFANSNIGQKRSIRKHIPKLLARFCGAAQVSCSKSAILQMVQVTIQICTEEAYDLSAWEVANALLFVSSLGTPECYLSAVRNEWAKADAAALFEATCRAVDCIVRHHPDAFMEVIPACSYVVRSLLDAFRSGGRTLFPGSETWDGPDDARQRLERQTGATREQARPWKIIGNFAPLDVAQAKCLSRVLVNMASKHVARPVAPSAFRPASAGMRGRGSGRPMATRAKNSARAFSRHASRVLADYFAMQSDPDPRRSVESPALRDALRPGLYAVADVCADHDRDLVMAELNAAGKALLKGFFADYAKEHKYTGKA